MELAPDPPRPETRRSIDVVIPAYNEEDCIEELARRLTLLFDSEADYEWSAIIVENGSSDATWPLLRGAHERDPRFRVVRLSRNFHMDGGLTAGLEYATADAVVFMTADLQDPPEAIPAFLRKWEDGYENVYGLVTERQGTSALRRFNSRAFYRVANWLTGGQLPENASDFRLMDRRLYETLRNLDERNRFMRGLVAWSGFSSAAVPVPRPPRFAGASKAYSLPVLGFAIRGIFANSYLPLRMITLGGLAVSVLSVVALVVLVVAAVTRGVPFAGFGTIIALMFLGFGGIALILGVMSEYLSLVYEEVKGRPNFVVQQTLGLPDGQRLSRQHGG